MTSAATRRRIEGDRPRVEAPEVPISQRTTRDLMHAAYALTHQIDAVRSDDYRTRRPGALRDLRAQRVPGPGHRPARQGPGLPVGPMSERCPASGTTAVDPTPYSSGESALGAWCGYCGTKRMVRKDGTLPEHKDTRSPARGRRDAHNAAVGLSLTAERWG